MQRVFVVLAIISLVVASVPVETAYAKNRPQEIVVRIVNPDMSVRSSFSVVTANDAGGMSVAVADLGSDGIAEIILGNGLGNEPRVHVLRQDGSEVGSFLAYDAAMGVGVNVAACDLDGDGTNEIVTVPMRGGASHVRVFNNFGTLIDPGFFAYDAANANGVNLACGDMDGDGRAELATLPAAGSGPDIKIWKRTSGTMTLAQEFFLFDATDTRGVVGAIGNKILRVAAQKGKDHETFDAKLSTDKNIVASVAQNDDADGATGMFFAGGRTYRTTSNAQIIDADSFVSSSYGNAHGTIAAAAGDIDGDGKTEMVVVDSRALYGGSATGKSVMVDLSEQRLYAYNNGLVDDSFLVSTARAPYQTPLGDHAIIAKIPLVHYAGGTGTEAYDLGWIPWNLRFAEHIYIHYAPWNHTFGYTLSHGCVNVSLDDIKWIYEWSDVGIPVTVQA